MRCSSCSADNPAGHRFCGHCGSPLAAACPSCGAELVPGHRFCGQCGAAVAAVPASLGGTPAPVQEPAGPPRAGLAERRRVSVLFVDLVGFTTLSESRDPEQVRDLLSAYFEQARTVVSRYGGTIEKFIGDAVMAVWGTPVAMEDDAERAVRAALDLVDAVSVLGEDAGRGTLRARAGVVTGEAAVRLDIVGEGMVAGDVVNTAARIQSIAEPGTVLVDETTREATARAITYAPAGEHMLKGKAEPVRVSTAVQVVAGSGGAQRFDGLEAPFLGRDRDLRMIKELFHDSAEHSRARLVVVSGAAGVGKSRLGWEFFKYLDGISQMALWHVGRCLSYGEGVAYWALAEMVRMRLRIAEGDPDDLALAKLQTGLDEYITDPEERRWLLPRLAVLLGLADLVAAVPGDLDRDSLFAGWRLFLERLAEHHPVVLLFEDLQYADAGLLDFVEHLLDWSAGTPLFMLALTRPELQQRRPDWGGHRRNVTSLYLEPMDDDAIGRMVDALVEGLPETTRANLAARAEGIPLFAVETVRMLIDRDLVVPRGGVYVLASDATDLTELDVPPTLQALVAARLDNLPEAERRLVKDASVLGHSFTIEAVASIVEAVGSVPVGDVEGLLASLARKEVLTLHADARSPEAGQYKYVQKVMRTVAYETLSRRDRKARHLAVAEHLLQAHDADDIAGVIASHYLEAADAVPDDPDAADLRGAARRHLELAGDRARALAAIEEAQRYYERALDLAEDDPERARLAELAGVMAHRAGRMDAAIAHYEIAHALLEQRGDRRGVARVVAGIGDVLTELDRIDEALVRMQAAYEALEGSPHDVDLARLANSLATGHFTLGDPTTAEHWLEIAIEAAEAAGAWDVLGRALNVKGLRLYGIGRPIEGLGLLRTALDLAVEHSLDRRAAIQTGNLGLFSIYRDLEQARQYATESIAFARKIGDRDGQALGETTLGLVDVHAGRWDDVDAAAYRDHAYQLGPVNRIAGAVPFVVVATWRGESDVTLGFDLDLDQDFDDVQGQATVLTLRALRALAGGDPAAGLDAARRAIEVSVAYSMDTDEFPFSWATAVDCALAAGRVDEAREIVAVVGDRPPGLVPPLFRGLLLWLRARVAAADPAAAVPVEQVTEDFESAARILRGHGAVPWAGRCLVDHAAAAAAGSAEGDAAALAEEALEYLRPLRVTAFVAQAESILAAARETTAVRSGGVRP
jgi:class 3 adenylate cyclase/tetratricopeptide (TPR) repeat protein